MGCERIERPRNHAQFICFDGYDDFTPVPHSMAALGPCTPTGSLRSNLPRCLPLDRVSAEPTLTSFSQCRTVRLRPENRRPEMARCHCCAAAA
jgi:hypothetical protein